ncbi:Crp/Fnr family transcriptional regulator [Actinoalloteichus sp. AHMU CJ021]|uniref:Crp/Fnr family transcriptional regulator n=1 Tax=Actinoalloteichus sp. AHMU CJ021 TaxID=2072503 RepID=UPI00307B82DE
MVNAGADSTEVLLVVDGLLKVVLPSEWGLDSITNLVGCGELVGELGVLFGDKRSAHVVALTSGTAVRVGASTFRSLLREHRDVHALVDHTARRRQRTADDRHRDQRLDVHTRVELSLGRWARAFGAPLPDGQLRVRGLGQGDVADAVAASVKHVEAAYARLRAEGTLRSGRLWYEIKP